MTLAPFTPPLRYRATLERNVESGLSPTNQPLPKRYEVVDGELACHYWEPPRAADASGAGLREGPNVVVVALGPRLLVGRRSDVRVEDIVTEVRMPDGEVVTGQRMRVEEILFRASHTEVGLELISSGPVVEGAAS